MLWRNRDFLKLWTGQTVSIFGSLLGALPFTAIFVLHASPFEMALLGAAGIVPPFAAGLLAGAWVDRLRRRPILIASDLGRAALLGSLAVSAAFDALTLAHLYVVAFLSGLLAIFFDVAYLAYLPAIVRREDLVEGNSKLAASASAAEMGSFSVGGWIVQLATAQVAVVVDALSFLVSALSLGAIHAREPEPPPHEERRAMRAEIAEGLGVLWHDPVLRAIGLSRVARDFSYGAVGAVILLYTVRELGFEPGVLGLIFAVGGVSSLVGAVFAARVTRRLGVGPAMTLGLLVFGLSTLLLPLAPGATALGAALLVGQQLFGDGAVTVYEIDATALRQSVAPARLLGRVDAGMRFAGLATTLAGTFAGGLLGDTVGMRPALAVGACGSLLGAAVLALSPAVRVRFAAGAAAGAGDFPGALPPG